MIKDEIKSVTPADINDNIKSVKYFNPTGTLTICVITLKNGFTVTGESACVDPKKYDKAIGEDFAFQNAFNKAWSFMGYALVDHEHKNRKKVSYKDRVIDEHAELINKITSLTDYLSGSDSSLLLKDDRALLEQQLSVMRDYQNILVKRMDRF